MKAVRIHAFGGPDVLSLDELAIPSPEDDGMVVRVVASSVNPVDYKIRSGTYKNADASQLPIAMGRDLSGVVETCGAQVRDFRAGDAVYALLGQGRGGNAEYVLVKPGEAAAKPHNLDHVAAAALPLAGLTAWQGLFDQGGLTAGQRVLIQGGAGGVGHLAIQFAKARGAFVATTVSTPDVGFAHDLGADTVIDYKTEYFEDALEPVDMVFDLVGGQIFERSWNMLKQGGILVSTLVTAPAEEAMRRGLRTAHYMTKPNAGELQEITRLIEAGKVKPTIAAVFPLAEAATAEAQLENQHNRGKIVLEAA